MRAWGTYFFLFALLAISVSLTLCIYYISKKLDHKNKYIRTWVLGVREVSETEN